MQRGSKEQAAESMAHHLYHILSSSAPDDVLIDDRTNKTIGQRVMFAEKMGYPFIIVCGKDVLEPVPKIELIDVYNGKKEMLTHAELINKLNYL